MNVQKIKVCLWGSMQWRLNKCKVPRRPRRVTGKAKKSVRVKKKSLFCDQCVASATDWGSSEGKPVPTSPVTVGAFCPNPCW